MNIAIPQRGTSFPSLIWGITKVGEEYGKPFPVDKETSIRPAISTAVKKKYPNRVYRATKTVKNGIPVIWVYLKEIKK